MTTQAFSVRRPNRDGTDWSTLQLDGVRILSCEQHRRKLRRGSHRQNRFRLRLRSPAIAGQFQALRERVASITALGVPNYFGEQRFGRGGSNMALARAVFDGKRLRRDKRGIALSAARAFLFNEILDRRVVDGSWNRLLEGELANLAGSGSVFAVDALTAELEERCNNNDIHPTASLWGDGAPLAAGQSAELQSAVASRHSELVSGLQSARMDARARALRVIPDELQLQRDGDALTLEFALPKGAFATAVLREIVDYG